MKNEIREDFRLGWRCGVADAYAHHYDPRPARASSAQAYREGYLRGHAAHAAGLPTVSSDADWKDYSKAKAAARQPATV